MAEILYNKHRGCVMLMRLIVASIASVGYGLGALIIGVEHKWIDYRKAYERIEKTLDTFINYVEGKNGFYYHFVNIQNGKRE